MITINGNMCLTQPGLPLILNLLIINNAPMVDLADLANLALIKHAQIDVNTFTVSGLSSGGYMANAMHYVFSSKVKASGIFAGLPFNIAYNVTSRDFLPAYAVNLILALLGRTQSELQAQVISLANEGIIDPIVNLKGSKAYVFQGSLDPLVPEPSGLCHKIINTYKYFGTDVKYLHLPFGTHSVPTDNFGSPCPLVGLLDDSVNNCGIESIFEMFEYFYGKNYKSPKSSTVPYTGTLYKFDQSPYTPSGNATTDFMNDHGGIYIPLACRSINATCKLHAAFHGCMQSMYTNVFYDKWAVHSGYLQVADTNNIIVVFPRTAAVFELQSNFKSNLACWDWFFGTTTSTVPFKQMAQVKSVANILNEIIGNNLFK